MTATIELLTYADLIDHLIDYTSANPSPHKERQAKRSIQQGYENLKNDFQWPYFWTVGRICTEAPYDTGTVTYDHSGGSVERQLTLSGGTWPDWAAYGSILVGTVFYEVADRFSDTILQLDINRSPKEDLTETSYQLVRDTYTLPSDFVNLDELYTPESWQKIRYVHPRVWLVSHRYNVTSASTPVFFTLLGSPDFMGSMSLAFYPFPDSAQTIDFVYQRKGRPLRVERVEGTGNATIGATVVNYVDGEAFADSMIGSVIRISASNATEFPSGRTGSNPYDEERVVMDVSTDGTQVTVDQQWVRTHTNAKYTISDPVDIEPGVMTGALLRRCEMEMAIMSRMEDRNMIIQLYEQFLDKHKNYASRVTHPRSAGDEGLWSRRLAFMPTGSDVD